MIRFLKLFKGWLQFMKLFKWDILYRVRLLSVEEFGLDSWLSIVSGYLTCNQDLLAIIETHVKLFDTYV